MNKYTLNDLEKMVNFFDIKDKNVLIYSSLFALGILDGFLLKETPNIILNFFEKNFKSVFFPTYNYDFSTNQFIDLTKLNSKMGLLSNLALENGYERTIHPMFSHCGNNLEIIEPKRVEINPFSEDSFFYRLKEENGQILIFGALPRQATYIIYTEFMNRVKYRYLKPFNGTVVNKYGQINDTFYHFVFPRSETIKHNYNNFHKLLIRNGKTKTFLLGNKRVYLIDMNIFFNEVTKFLDKNAYGLVNKTPKYQYQFINEKEKKIREILEKKDIKN